MSTLVGYRKVSYTQKTTGKLVEGYNLYMVVPPTMDGTIGHEVINEFVKPEIVASVDLKVGMNCEIVYGKGFGGKAVVTRLLVLE